MEQVDKRDKSMKVRELKEKTGGGVEGADKKNVDTEKKKRGRKERKKDTLRVKGDVRKKWEGRWKR